MDIESLTIPANPRVHDLETVNETGGNQMESWLPITESRQGNVFTCVFLLLSSGLGFQALLLPPALAILGWAGGLICLSVAFTWQLYTTWLLVHLHEPAPGNRHSRYIRLSIAAFGGKMGKLLTMFPIMYLSGGSCVLLTIVGGTAMEQLHKILFVNATKSPTGAQWFLIFTCIAFVLTQFPNLNSIWTVSLVGAITSVVYCTLLWVLPIRHHMASKVSHDPTQIIETGVSEFYTIGSAIGFIVFAFKGHNLILEIQGTLPSNTKAPSSKLMWKAVVISYVVIAMCLFPLAIAGYWAFGNTVPLSGGNVSTYLLFYGQAYSKRVIGITHVLFLISCFTSYQIYSMPTIDTYEFIFFVSRKQQPCPLWVRTCLRLLFGGIVLCISVTFPFLPRLSVLVGGVALPLTFAYPCFMWLLIKTPRPMSRMWCFNLGLGCLGLCLSVLVVVSGALNLGDKGLHANFFNPS